MSDTRTGLWKKAETIGQVLRDVLQGQGPGQGGRPNAMRKAWLDAVGAEAGKQTRVVGLRRGTLVVEVESATLRQELALYRREGILLSLQGVLGTGAIRDIQFRMGRF